MEPFYCSVECGTKQGKGVHPLTEDFFRERAKEKAGREAVFVCEACGSEIYRSP